MCNFWCLQEMTSNAQNSNGFCHDPDSHIEEPEEVEIPVPWGHISGRWWGPRTKQPILCLHGWQDNAGTFDTLAPLLRAAGHTLLALDMMGHGRSSHYPKGQMYFLYWDGVMLVRRVCQHFGWDKVSKLISIDIVGPVIRSEEKTVTETGSMIDKVLDYERKLEKNIPSYMMEDVIDIVMDAYRGSLTRESCKILLKRGVVTSEDGKGIHFARDPRLKVAGFGSLAAPLVLQYASQIRCEVLNIKGKQGTAFDSEEQYHKVLDAVRASAKRLEFHEVEGTHHLHLNNPENASPIIHNFLQRE
ncbi:hypothetical protein B566_EDAN008688 [Ephemera danica]|nr:hypothetical protein B566_EDAN008688 [Ephemera danica]